MNNAIFKTIERILYILFTISFLSIFIPYIIAYVTNEYVSFGLAMIVGYLNIVLLPTIALTLIILLIMTAKEIGLVKAIKEISLKVFAILLGASVIWLLYSLLLSKANQIEVIVSNKSSAGISNIKLMGRNALTEIDTLAPNQFSKRIFNGRTINYKTENDFENEIKIIYYTNKEWKEEYILKGFNRWMEFNGPFQIELYDNDSISFSYIKE